MSVETTLNIGGGTLVVIGLFFMGITAVGLLRLPDFYTRAHAVSKSETLGLGLVMLGLALYNGVNIVSLKLLLAMVFVFLANPVATHLLIRAAVRQGVKPWTRTAPGSDTPALPK